MEVTLPISSSARVQPVRGLSSSLWRRRHNLSAALWRLTWLPSFLIILSDVLCWLAAYGLFSALRRDAAIFYDSTPTFLLGILPLATLIFTLFTVGGYDRRTDMVSLTYMSEHLIGMIAAGILTSLLVYGVATFEVLAKPSRGVLLLSFAAFTPLSLLYRRAIHRHALAVRSKRHFLVLGSGPAAQAFYRTYLESSNRQSLRFAQLESGAAAPMANGAKSAAFSASEAHKQLDLLSPQDEGIIIAEPIENLTQELLDKLAHIHFRQTPVYTLESFHETYWRKIPVLSLDSSWPLRMGFQLVRESVYSHAKRLFDMIASGLALALLSPVLLLIGLLTWWDSGRPVIFRQTRVGCGNEPFTILKFRTMHTRPAGSEGDLYTRPNDSRITRLGAWLRKLRLDELPQLWNVFKGDMSLIGPRAEWIKCVELYDGKIPCYHLRHLVKPGITGWAQVNYPYGESEADALEKLKYDLYYIRHYSLRLDAMIVLKTLHIMFWGMGR